MAHAEVRGKAAYKSESGSGSSTVMANMTGKAQLKTARLVAENGSIGEAPSAPLPVWDGYEEYVFEGEEFPSL